MACAGEVKGRILVTKALTKKRVVLPNYQTRSATLPTQQGPAKQGAEHAQAGDEFSRLVVYVDDLPLSGSLPTSATLAQKNVQFAPEILVVPVGTSVSFPNQDTIFHNVFSLSKAKQFDLGYYPAGQTRTVKFEKAGVIQVYCHIHRDMNAAILVVPNQWYMRPGKDGTFTLSEIPAGTHYVVVWHKSAGFFRKRVEVPETGASEVSFEIPIPSTE
jgi:plastocyanin